MSDGGNGLRSAAYIPAHKVARMPDIGSVVDGRYALRKIIGRGGVGIVFKASDQQTGELVALKILMPEVLDQDVIVERFRREASLSSSLTSPHTVHIHGFGVHGAAENVLGLPFIVMELLQGEDLEAFMERRTSLPIEEALAITQQSLISLKEAHERGIIHRDIKPQNIFLSGAPGHRASVKILDFGIAKGISSGDDEVSRFERLTETGLVCGTPQFMAPEQAEGRRDLTAAVDVYNLACVLYRMLTGKLLYEGITPYDVAYQHVMSPIPPFPPVLEGNQVGAMLHHTLAKKPEDRLSDAAEFERVLEGVIERMDLEPLTPHMPGAQPVPDVELPPPVAPTPRPEATPTPIPAPPRPQSAQDTPGFPMWLPIAILLAFVLAVASALIIGYVVFF